MEHHPNHAPATPEEIWNILRTVSKEQKELSRQMKETDKQITRTSKQMEETDRRLKKLDELFTGQWGKLMESLVEGDLVALLQKKGVEVQSTYSDLKGRRHGEQYQYDIVAANGEEVVVVEVKTTLRAGDVTQFLDKLGKFSDRMRVYRGNRIMGAVAYLRVEQSAEVYAERQGLYVIRATGSSASIINQSDFQPKVFE